MPAGPLDPRWADNANCGSCDAEALFSTSSAQREMKDICRNCSVRLMCLADALQSNMRYGLWGGMTERERRQLLRTVPEQADWYESITSSPDPIFVAIREGKPLHLSRRQSQKNNKVKEEQEESGDEDESGAQDD